MKANMCWIQEVHTLRKIDDRCRQPRGEKDDRRDSDDFAWHHRNMWCFYSFFGSFFVALSVIFSWFTALLSMESWLFFLWVSVAFVLSIWSPDSYCLDNTSLRNTIFLRNLACIFSPGFSVLAKDDAKTTKDFLSLQLRPQVPATEARNLKIAQSGLERVQKLLWQPGERVSQESLAPMQPCFAPAQQAFAKHTLVTGKSLDSPEKGNVRKMSKNCLEGLKTQFSDCFWTIFAYFVGAFVWWPCPMRAHYKHTPNTFCTLSQPLWAILRFPTSVASTSRERRLNTNFLFLKLFGRPRDIPAKSRDIPPKKFDSCVSRDISNFLAPTPSRGKPLPHWKISGPKSLGLGSFFFPELRVATLQHRKLRWSTQLTKEILANR